MLESVTLSGMLTESGKEILKMKTLGRADSDLRKCKQARTISAFERKIQADVEVSSICHLTEIYKKVTIVFGKFTTLILRLRAPWFTYTRTCISTLEKCIAVIL